MNVNHAVSITQRKSAVDSKGRLQGNILHNNMEIPVPHARQNVENPVEILYRENYEDALTDLMDYWIKEYDKREPNKSRRYGNTGNWFLKKFGCKIDSKNANSILESVKKTGKGKYGVKSFEEEIIQLGNMFDFGYERPKKERIDEAVERAKTPEEKQEIIESVNAWKPENSQLAEKILRAYYEGYEYFDEELMIDVKIPSIQERNPNFKYFNVVMHHAEATPHLHVDYIAYGTDCRGVKYQISFDKALRANLEHNGVKTKDDKGKPIDGRKLFTVYRGLERDVLRRIAEHHGVNVKSKEHEVTAEENRAKPKHEQRKDLDIHEFKKSKQAEPIQTEQAEKVMEAQQEAQQETDPNKIDYSQYDFTDDVGFKVIEDTPQETKETPPKIAEEAKAQKEMSFKNKLFQECGVTADITDVKNTVSEVTNAYDKKQAKRHHEPPQETKQAEPVQAPKQAEPVQAPKEQHTEAPKQAEPTQALWERDRNREYIEAMQAIERRYGTDPKDYTQQQKQDYDFGF